MKKSISLLAISAVVLTLLFVAFSSAAFSYNKVSSAIQTTYVSGETVKGSLNINFSKEPSDSPVTSNFPGGITLIDLLNENSYLEGEDYTCSRAGCAVEYSASDSINSLALNANTPAYVGFKLTGNEVSINSIKLNVESDAGNSCKSQILIDVLDKNETFLQNYKNSGNTCGSKYFGCFDNEADYSMADISNYLYCEKIRLPAAAAYRAGAVIKRTSSADSLLKMELKDSDWISLGACELPAQATETEELECLIEVGSTEEQDFVVCLNSEDEDSGRQIKVEQEGKNCGTDTESEPYTLDYEIFAKPVEFAAVGTIGINESVFEEQNYGESLAGYVESYIYENYNNNCSKGCVIPFKITGLSQNLALSDAEIKYRQRGGATVYTNNGLYEVVRKASTITSGELSIDVEKAGFKIPISSTDKTLSIYIGEKSVFPSVLKINLTKGFDFNIVPNKVSIGEKTTFMAVTSADISSSKWTFGDGTTKTVEGKVVTHRYLTPQEGFSVEVELTRKDNVKAVNVFDINTTSLSESATKLVAEYEKRIAGLKGNISKLDSGTASEVNSALDIAQLEGGVAVLKASLNNASRDYAEIINELVALNIPSSISVKEKASNLPLIIGYKNIDTRYIEEISNSELSTSADRDLAKQAITAWLNANYDATIGYNVISMMSERDEPVEEVLLSRFRIDISRISESAADAYLIIGRSKNSLLFANNYSAQEVGSGVYIPITDSKTIEFSIADDVKAEELGAYISPSLGEIYQTYEKIGPSGFQWGKFIKWFLIILACALVLYIVLQEWYKRRYEDFLFKNRNDLFNLLTFIYNARKRGLSDEETRKKLKSAGWSGEKIDYAFKKIDGKRTGMWEIPIFSFFEKKKIEHEIEKRRTLSQTPVQKPI